MVDGCALATLEAIPGEGIPKYSGSGAAEHRGQQSQLPLVLYKLGVVVYIFKWSKKKYIFVARENYMRFNFQFL